MFIPYCKFEDDCVTRWSYKNYINPELENHVEYAYCSLFRNSFAIFGEYLGNPKLMVIQFGIIDINLNIIIPPIYSSLEFYPNSDCCLIGNLEINMNFQKDNYHKETIFNLKKKFWFIGKEIIPINGNLFLLVNAPFDLKIYSIDGELRKVLPFILKRETSLPQEEHNNSSLIFEKVENCNDYFRVRYWTNGTIRWPAAPYEDFDDDEYWEKEYWLFFNSIGEKIGESENKNELTPYNMISGWRSNLEELKWVPKNFIPFELSSVYNNLLDDGILKSQERFPSSSIEKFIFQSEDITPLWHPSKVKISLTTSVFNNLNFGQNKGERYIDIFKYNSNYIEWIIKETDIVFDQLSNFLINGEPKRLIFQSLSKINVKKFASHIRANNKISKSGSYMLTFRNVCDLKDLGIINEQNFEEIPYDFSEELYMINQKKIDNLYNLRPNVS